MKGRSFICLKVKVKVKVIHYLEGTVLVLALLLILTIYYSPFSVFAWLPAKLPAFLTILLVESVLILRPRRVTV